MSKKELLREISGLLVLGVGGFFMLSLVSFHPQDPSFNLYQPLPANIHNLGGVLGAYLADLLWQLLGCASFLLPIALCAKGIRLLARKRGEHKGLRRLGFVILLPSCAALLDIAFGGVRVLSYQGRGGGVVGGWLARITERFLGGVGGGLLISLTFVASAILATGVSISEVVRVAIGFFAAVWRWFVQTKDLYLGRWKKRREVRRIGRATSQPPIISPQEVDAAPIRQETLPFPSMTAGRYHLPPLSLLEERKDKGAKISEELLRANAQILEGKLKDYGVEGKVVGVRPGPIVTVYEFEPAAGVKVNKILNLDDDLALALSALSVRIQAPIPGRSVVGIELPNPVREVVSLKEVVGSELFQRSASLLTLAIGKDISGNPFVIDLARLPHLLVAGSTGSGKSVSINAMICSLLLRATPEEVKFLLIDPKMLELPAYDGIPHLLLPVVTDAKEASVALRWMVEEMERRYAMMAQHGIRNIENYNQKVVERGVPPAEGEERPQRLPYVLVVIDELADLMIVSGREVEESIIRLAQMARAAGIHLILATQRPSVDVLTGLIKVNFPARISFQVSTKTDSRTILDTHGAEHLLGSGDMLFLPPGSSRLQRVHGAYVSEGEIRRLVEFWRAQGGPTYDREVLHERRKGEESEVGVRDAKYEEAVAYVMRTGQASISLIQRRFRIGYNRAARIIEQMEEDGIVGPADGVKPREVLIRKF